ncbi:arginyl-tRNA--protein transferase 1-like [Littorina saxatilis]|uniref:Arginyl-tRNA--protein transferase 1 n=1 Tax=Littorina saxatilis TaxID=31220 RepID=A0AAN9GH75_9CAEN
MAKRERSIVEYFAEHERYRCGYCGSSDTNYSHGMWAHSMTVQDYQDLIDRGWRRSGKYCYKPTMNMTCCPQYTIRCDVPNFKLSKSQKKIIKRVNRYLITGQKPGSKDSGDDDSANAGDEGPSGDSFVPGKKSEFSLSASDVKNDRTGASEKPSASEKKGNVGSESKKADVKESVDEKADKKTSPKSAPTKGQGPDNSKPPCRKAKQIRLERKMQKSGLSLDEIKTKNQNKTKEGKSLEDMLNEPLKAENPAHRLEMKLIRSSPKSREFLETYVHAHKVYLKYQTTIHKDPPDKPNLKQYTRFLVDSPLEPVIAEPGERGLPEGYGSFHQHYMLDGKLIAVGVIDILPNCVSSVYLYYDPDYSFLSLGTYSALREVAFVRELHRMVPALRFYYMGFYIHSCPKMRYKGQYYPSFLVCPEAYTWVPIERCAPKLDASHYARLEEPGKEDPETPVDINRVLVLHDREAMAYEVYSFMEKDAHDEDEVKEYAALVGMTCAQRMLLFRK